MSLYCESSPAPELRLRIGALQRPDVTGVEETGCIDQSEPLCQDGAGRSLGRATQNAACPLPGKYFFLGKHSFLAEQPESEDSPICDFVTR